MKKRIFINNLEGYTLILPALVFYIFFILYPLFNVVRSSTFKLNTLSQQGNFTGILNYVDLFKDKIFWRALLNTTIYTIAIIILINFFAIIFAIIIDRGKIKGNYFLRVMFFIPAILPPVLIGAAFKRIFAPFGALNMILTAIDLPFLEHNWLGEPSWALFAIIITTVWQSAGWNMVIFLARLKEIPRELYEAASIDGASEWGIIRKIKLPLLKEALIILVVLNIIGGFKVFDLVYVMTGGGPAHKTEVLTSMLYYQAFSFHNYGYASSIAVVMLVIMLLFSWLRIKGTLRG
ncbi:MAG: sugar ABC transporter permease [Actinobacteria bacterium]|nr:sugar ABC transporter permease [Actinomycetota bacterium]